MDLGEETAVVLRPIEPNGFFIMPALSFSLQPAVRGTKQRSAMKPRS